MEYKLSMKSLCNIDAAGSQTLLLGLCFSGHLQLTSKTVKWSKEAIHTYNMVFPKKWIIIFLPIFSPLEQQRIYCWKGLFFVHAMKVSILSQKKVLSFKEIHLYILFTPKWCCQWQLLYLRGPSDPIDSYFMNKNRLILMPTQTKKKKKPKNLDISY